MKTIGDRLKEERQRLKFSQEKFAGYGGVQRTAQINYESNKRRPDSDYLHKIALIGADVQYILTGRKGAELTATEPTHEKLYNSKKTDTYKNSAPGEQTRSEGTTSDDNLGPLSLDERLEKVIDDYISDDVITMIVTTIQQVLSERGVTLDEDTKTRLIAAARDGYDQLVAGGRTEKFNDLLLALIDAVLEDYSI